VPSDNFSLDLFTRHPHSVGETYFEHLRFATSFGVSMVVGGLACMVHGLLPFLCVTSGSRRVRQLHAVLQSGPRRHVAEPPASVALNWSI